MRKVSVFVAVLCYSRLVYIEFTVSQRKAEDLPGPGQRPDLFRRQSPQLIFDNLKAAVLNGSGRSACLHPEFPGPVPAISVCSRSPVPDAIRNRRELSKATCAT